MPLQRLISHADCNIVDMRDMLVVDVGSRVGEVIVTISDGRVSSMYLLPSKPGHVSATLEAGLQTCAPMAH